uniref:Uncharacterized protein n=1 Tax=Theropithecus gelada TaxID=9565 RepID=A0A8D2FN88_THEGE
MRYNHDKLNLSSTNRPEITHRILFRKPYSPSNRSLPHPNPLKLLWCNHPHSRPWTHLLHIFLPSQLKL